ncbi:hypothetical protein SAMN05660330_03744 [Desulforhopalus singaporensis]|uniref:Uncharacterized protein n=1 Tax=Desulforhopalus singaporensis TaxID=91360 RepID=A0A1H0UVF2_9BACT|nr:hypothetical protein SAMN05660330_03744 [Desulforhopalus singaporensis]
MHWPFQQYEGFLWKNFDPYNASFFAGSIGQGSWYYHATLDVIQHYSSLISSWKLFPEIHSQTICYLEAFQ